jgi:hypothetical protein
LTAPSGWSVDWGRAAADSPCDFYPSV